MDVVSEILGTVKLQGAFYFNGEFSAPWGVRTPPSHVLAPYFGGPGRHVIIFHLLTEGAGVAALEKSPFIPLAAGDIVVFPHGDPHIVGSASSVPAVDYAGELHRVIAQGLRLTRTGGGGPLTKFVCGYLMCDPRLSQTFLAALPRVFKVSIRDQPAAQWLEHAIQFSVTASESSPAGSQALLARLAEALFIETLRCYIAALPPSQTGWLAGARDPSVGQALALLHAKPAQEWTIESLARAVGLSRSVLADRFRHFLGEPPISYLTRWRLQLGAQLLQTTSHAVAHIAGEVGYQSEAAFNRAFRRQFGLPPARFRDQSRQDSPNPIKSSSLTLGPVT